MSDRESSRVRTDDPAELEWESSSPELGLGSISTRDSSAIADDELEELREREARRIPIGFAIPPDKRVRKRPRNSSAKGTGQ